MSRTPSPEILIYVVDDDGDDYLTLQELISQHWKNIQTKHFLQPYQIIKGMESMELPSLIVLDINLPGVNGLDLYEVMKDQERWKDVPIVFLTICKDSESYERAMALGAAGYFIKPAKIDQWNEVIASMLTVIALKGFNGSQIPPYAFQPRY
jgi:response regulator RpfG family c-di-GMP phosphodiesterase